MEVVLVVDEPSEGNRVGSYVGHSVVVVGDAPSVDNGVGSQVGNGVGSYVGQGVVVVNDNTMVKGIDRKILNVREVAMVESE